MKFGITIIEQEGIDPTTIASVVCEECGAQLKEADLVFWEHNKPATFAAFCGPCEDKNDDRLSGLNSIQLGEWLHQLLAVSER